MQVTKRIDVKHAQIFKDYIKKIVERGMVTAPDKNIKKYYTNSDIGDSITQDGFQPLQNKVTGIRKYPKPNMVNELRRVLVL